MMGAIHELINTIKSAFAEPDPKRFALSAPPPNWNGVKADTGKRSGAVLVNERTNTFEFGRTNVDIPEHLTELDKAALSKRGLDPGNPAYTACKAYFAKMPMCDRKDLAANSGGEDFPGITAHTAKNVLAAFREYLIDKPTF
jgi:hypothetical protein